MPDSIAWSPRRATTSLAGVRSRMSSREEMVMTSFTGAGARTSCSEGQVTTSSMRRTAGATGSVAGTPGTGYRRTSTTSCTAPARGSCESDRACWGAASAAPGCTKACETRSRLVERLNHDETGVARPQLFDLLEWPEPHRLVEVARAVVLD